MASKPDLGSCGSVIQTREYALAFGVFHGPKLDPVDRTDGSRSNHFRHLGTAFTEADVEQANLETVVTDLMYGRYSDPVRVVAFNTAEHWAEDVSQDVVLAGTIAIRSGNRLAKIRLSQLTK